MWLFSTRFFFWFSLFTCLRIMRWIPIHLSRSSGSNNKWHLTQCDKIMHECNIFVSFYFLSSLAEGSKHFCLHSFSMNEHFLLAFFSVSYCFMKSVAQMLSVCSFVIFLLCFLQNHKATAKSLKCTVLQKEETRFSLHIK